MVKHPEMTDERPSQINDHKNIQEEKIYRVPPWIHFVMAMLVLWTYTCRISINRLTWEEPRLCLISPEMIYSGDFLVPRCLNEHYRFKPPFLNWLLVIVSGFHIDRLDPFRIRLISLLAMSITALMLATFQRLHRSGGTIWLPFLLL